MIKKSMGPSIVPWVIPPFTEDQSEKTLPILTLCRLDLYDKQCHKMAQIFTDGMYITA
jgi:hypothetical protein